MLTYFSSFLVYLLVFYEYFMRICKNMCKFNPKNHYYFSDSLHFFKSYKIKSEPSLTFSTTIALEVLSCGRIYSCHRPPSQKKLSTTL